MDNLWVICCKVRLKHIELCNDYGFIGSGMLVPAHRKIIFG